ncbi:uncharacterized protein LOC114416002 [Glycine soja]|nr:uncharacterized protein LOC114416002 [Glycine soja]
MKIDSFLIQQNFTKCTTKHGVYVRNTNSGEFLIICLYVDDLLVTGSSKEDIIVFKGRIMDEFEMSDLGELSYFLGIEFVSTSKGIFMHQKKYAEDILKRFNMMDCNSVITPTETGIKLQIDGDEKEVNPTLYKQIVGSLRYLCNTRPDIAYYVVLISRFMEKPKTPHFLAAKRILRYVKGTLDLGILYPYSQKNIEGEVFGYSDSDWCGDKDDRKSIAGYVFKFGTSPISWCSKKQSVVALSTCEAEYIAAAMAACQALWLEALMEELNLRNCSPMRLLMDNKSAIDLAKHPVAHGRSKHIETKFHFLRDQVNKEKLELEFCRSEDQVADILTKPLKSIKFNELRDKLGVTSLTNLN